MTGPFVDGTHLFGLDGRNSSEFWSSIIPALLVFILCLFRLSSPLFTHKFFRILKTPFEPYMTLLEAEALDTDHSFHADTIHNLKLTKSVSFWRPIGLSLMGLVETLCWLAYGSFLCISGPTDSDAWEPYQPFLIAASWLYTVVRPITSPSATPPYDLCCIYCVHFIAGAVRLGEIIYDNQVLAMPLPPVFGIFIIIANLAIVLGLLANLATLPMALPSDKVRKEDIVSCFVST